MMEIGDQHYGYAILQLIKSWWKTDRMRTASSTGRLLRLQPGAYICIDDRRGEVVSRTVGQTVDASWVEYVLEFQRTTATLTAVLNQTSHAIELKWKEGESEHQVYESEMTVFEA